MQDMISFLRLVLPTAPYYAAVVAEPETKKYTQRAIGSVDLLANVLLTASNDGKNAFFGCAGFGQSWHDDPDGRKNLDGSIKKVFRTQVNAHAMRAFWLDLDVEAGNEKKYDTQAAAAQDLARFVKLIGLPTPLIVNSGGGLHVYWPLSKDISAVNWNKVAALLDAVVKYSGLKADPSRTMDAASILRPVHTTNWKPEYGEHGHPVKVARAGEPAEPIAIVECLRAYAASNGVTPTIPTSSSVKPVTSVPVALQGVMQNPAFMQAMGHVMTGQEQQDKNPQRIIKLCQQVREAGKELEPAWFAMMTVMKCCYKGKEAARILSKLDSRYSEDGFEEKWRYVESQNGGPAVCTTFDRECPGKCNTCPYKGKIRSPAELGREMRQAVTETPVQVTIQTTPPANLNPLAAALSQQVSNVYLINDPRFEMKEGEGLFHIKEEQVDGDEPVFKRTLLMPQCIYLLSAQRMEVSFSHAEMTYIWMVTEKGQPQRQVRMIARDFKSDIALREWCFNNQLLVTPGKEKLKDEFMRTYLAQMQRKIPQIVMREHFGWTQSKSQDGATSLGFITGDTLIAAHMPPTTIGLRPVLESFAEERLTSMGELEVWKNVPAFYQRHNIMWGQFGICLAFGATLMKFAPGAARNGIVNFWGISGTGKTTIQRVINSVWGHPEKMLLNVQSTNNSRYKMMGWLRNMPICIDEATKLNEQELSDTLFQISEGEEKERLNTDGSLQQSGSWNTIAVISANHAVLDKMAAFLQQRDAEVKRVLDIETLKCPGAEVEAVQMERTIERNFGVAGTYFLQRLLDNEKVLASIPVAIDRWSAVNSNAQDERYWNSTVACAMIAGRLAKSMGLIDFDMDMLEVYALREIKRMRSALISSKSSGTALLADMLADKMREMLVVKTAERIGAIDASMPTHMDEYIRRMPLGTLDIRIELDTNTVYVRKSAFNAWCSDHNITARTLLSELALSGIYDANQGTVTNRGEQQIRMSRGVPTLPSTGVRCYKLVLGPEAGLDAFAGTVNEIPDTPTEDS